MLCDWLRVLVNTQNSASFVLDEFDESRAEKRKRTNSELIKNNISVIQYEIVMPVYKSALEIVVPSGADGDRAVKGCLIRMMMMKIIITTTINCCNCIPAKMQQQLNYFKRVHI